MTRDELRYRFARGVGMISAGEVPPRDWTFEQMWKVLSREYHSEGAQMAIMDYCGRMMSEFLDSSNAASNEVQK